MRKVLDDLYYGNIAPSEKTFPPQSEYAKAMKTVDACEDALTAALDAEGQQKLQTLMAAQREVSDLSIREAFVDGFRLGMKLMLAALMEDDGVLRPLE